MSEKHCDTCTCGRRGDSGRRAPVQGDIGLKGPGTVSWEEHCEAWSVYAACYGRSQDPEVIAQRGGFGYHELRMFLGRDPATWRPR